MLVMSGQLFYNGAPAPLFTIIEDSGEFYASVISELTAEILHEQHFHSIGDACEWVYGHDCW